MSSPKISVIVPVYNVEKYLSRCIDSILAQTFTDFELLLINDGSPDNSAFICNEYAEKDSRVKVFHKKNGGVSSARNIGLENAKGEWIAFADADDWVESKWLEWFIINVNNSDLLVQGFYATNWPYAKTKEEINVNLKEYLFKKEDIVDCINCLQKSHNVGFLWCRFFKKKIVDDFNIRFNESYPLREDQEFIFHYMTKIYSVRTISSCGYHYGCPSYSSKYKSMSFVLDMEITRTILKYIKVLDPYKKSLANIECANRMASSIISNYKNDFDWSSFYTYGCTFYENFKNHGQFLNLKAKFLLCIFRIINALCHH